MATDDEGTPQVSLGEPLPPGMVESGSPSQQKGPPPLSTEALEEASDKRQVSPGLKVESLSPLHQEYVDRTGLSTPTGSAAGSKPATSRQGSKERRPSKLTPSQSSRRPSFRNSKSELELGSPGGDPSSPPVRLQKRSGDATGTSYSDVEPFAAAGLGRSPSKAGSGSRNPSKGGYDFVTSFPPHGASPMAGDGRGASKGSRSRSHTSSGSPPRPTAEDIYAELRADVDSVAQMSADEGGYDGRLALAALARLRVWERGDGRYTVHELMDLVRWMEARTEPEPSRSKLLWMGFRTTKTKYRVCPIVLAFFLLGVVLVVISAVTAAALIITIPAPIATTGLLEGGEEEQPAGLAAAMIPHSLLDYERLSAGQLRRAEDAVLQQHGDFHYYRLAGATQLLNGGVRLAAQDGSIIRVDDQVVSLKPAWSHEEVVDADGLARLEGARGSSSLSFAGAFRALSPH